MRLPISSIIAVIIRDNQVIIPRGNDVLLAADRVLVFALTDEIKEVIDYLTKEDDVNED